VATKILTAIDLAQNELRNAKLANLASAPSSPVTGQVYFDTTLNQLGVYGGSGPGWAYVAVGDVGQASNSSASGIMKVSAGANRNIADYAGGVGLVKSSSSGVVSAAVANTDYAPVASPTFTGTVTVPTPSVTGAAATKGYVDGLVQGISAKYSAVAATTGTETFTVASGSVTQISGTTLDGQSPAVNDYVLVKDAPAATGTGSAGSSQPGNGLYQVTSNTTNLSLSRAADMSGSNAPAGAYVFVSGGTAGGGGGYVVTTPATSAAFTYGSGAIQFTQFSGAGEITAGTGLAKSGNTLSLATPVSTSNGGTGGGSVAAAKTSLGFGSIYNSGAIGDGSSTTLTVTHNLGNTIPIVQVYDVSGANPVQVVCDVTATSSNAVQLGFGAAPASGSIKCVVMG
jgi:hypothetical protein